MNQFDAVHAIFTLQGTVPSTDMLRTRHDYVFYPFEYDGDVYTIDGLLWSACHTVEYPEECAVQDYLNHTTNEQNAVYLIALSHHKANHVDHSLVSFQRLQHQQKMTFQCIGFDVVDDLGISMLTNIGYTKNEARDIRNARIAMNPYGLIKEYEDTVRLVNLIAPYCSEHYPDNIVEVWMKM